MASRYAAAKDHSATPTDSQRANQNLRDSTGSPNGATATDALDGPVQSGSPAARARPHTTQRRVDLVFLAVSALVATITHDQAVIGLVGSFVLTFSLAWAALVFAGYGGLDIVRWAGRHALHELGSLGRLMTVAVPRSALIVAVLLLTTESWQTAGSVHGPRYLWSLALLYGAALAFSSRAARGNIDHLAHGTAPDPPDVTYERCVGTPASALCGIPDPEQVGVAAEIPLNRRQRVNVAAVFAVALVVQVTLVSLAVGLFVIALGALVVPLSTIDAWLPPGGGHVLLHLTRDVVITEELLRVGGFVMAFSALSFTVSAVTDDTFRNDFFDTLLEPLSKVAAARTVYLAVRGGTSPG